ncbi:MAG: superoxide dismutase [Candidatus Nezhaarchaeota archaeon]|nr:superoxide dismutase [Candidatus Nezhaarchaeota archaeon]
MEAAKFYVLPRLPYGYGDLAPYMSEEQLRIHHTIHHQAYVNGANAVLKRLDAARKENLEVDVKAALKELSWNVGGHILHSLFWTNMAPPSKGGGKPGGELADLINSEFGSFDRFRKEFTQAAVTVEGSGWAALTICKQTNRLMIMQIEKHNVNVFPSHPVLMVLDVFEHAYYIDYKNRRADYVEAFWSIVNWDEVNRRLKQYL